MHLASSPGPVGDPPRPAGLTLRSQITIAVASVSLVAVAVAGGVAYREAVTLTRQSALGFVGATATARRASLLLRLHNQEERATILLTSASRVCGAGEAGTACLRAYVETFIATERADAALLSTAGGPVLLGEEAKHLEAIPQPLAGQIAVLAAIKGKHFYVITTKGPGTSLRLLLPATLLDSVFLDREGLGASGESFLADADGFFVTTPRYPVHSDHGHPIAARPMKLCLAGQDGEMIAPDYRGVLVVHGLRYVPEIGGGCIMAHFDENEAFAPARSIGAKTAAATAAFGALMLFVAFFVGALLSRSVRGIATAAEGLGRGKFDWPANVKGPKEVRDLSQTLGAAARELEADITRRKAQEDLQQMTIGVLGHDLRNPLSAIAMSVALLRQRGGLDAAQERGVTRIGRSADRMARMVSELLDLTRAHGGGIPIQPVPADFDDLCRDVVEELRIAHPDAELRLRAEARTMGEWDPDRLKQVVSNMIGNAISYGRPGAPIDVRTRRDGDEVAIEVHNEGEPIPAEITQRIFEPYLRGAKGAAGTGLGLGLYIVSEIVRAHGGTIDVASSAADGTTFAVTLPTTARRPAVAMEAS